MKRVAIFGNAGSGKSTIARRLAELTGLPLYVVDMMQFRSGGIQVPRPEFLQAHAICCGGMGGSSTGLAVRLSLGSVSRPPIP